MADILLDTSKIAILLFIVAECPFDKRSSVWIILVITRGLEIGVCEVGSLLVHVLGMATRDALHGKAVITNQHDIHVRGLIVRLSVGCFCKHRKLDAEIDLIVGRAIERNRALGTYPSEEITGNAPPLPERRILSGGNFWACFRG